MLPDALRGRQDREGVPAHTHVFPLIGDYPGWPVSYEVEWKAGSVKRTIVHPPSPKPDPCQTAETTAPYNIIN